AVRHAHARRRRRGRGGRGRAGQQDGSPGARRTALARRRAQDRGRRQRRAGDRRLPRREAIGMSILVFAEHHENELQKGALGVLSKAATLGDSNLAAVSVGEGAKALAGEAARYGAKKVYVAEGDAL